MPAFDHASDHLGWLSVDSMFMYHNMAILNEILATSELQYLAQSRVTRRNVCERETRQSQFFHFAIPAIQSESGHRRFMFTAALG